MGQYKAHYCKKAFENQIVIIFKQLYTVFSSFYYIILTLLPTTSSGNT
jgi:cytochrome c biogenesis protein ResB